MCLECITPEPVDIGASRDVLCGPWHLYFILKISLLYCFPQLSSSGLSEVKLIQQNIYGH